jgi:hypothetical protein
MSVGEKPGNLIYLTYFNAGLRVCNIKDPLPWKAAGSSRRSRASEPALLQHDDLLSSRGRDRRLRAKADRREDARARLEEHRFQQAGCHPRAG